MKVNHVHTTAIAVYHDGWHIKPKSGVREWLSDINNMLCAITPYVIVEKLRNSIFIHVVSDSWNTAECMLDVGKCVSTNREMRMFIDNHWNEIVNLDYSVIQRLLPD